jgi:hypothetical protein
MLGDTAAKNYSLISLLSKYHCEAEKGKSGSVRNQVMRKLRNVNKILYKQNKEQLFLTVLICLHSYGMDPIRKLKKISGNLAITAIAKTGEALLCQKSKKDSLHIRPLELPYQMPNVHTEPLAARITPPKLKTTLDKTVAVVTFIKAQPLNSHICISFVK